MGAKSGEKDSDILNFVGSMPQNVLIRILNASPNCIKLVNLDGRLVFMNLNGRRALGLNASFDLYGLYWHDLWPKDRQDEIKQAVSRAANGEFIEFDAVLPMPNGSSMVWSQSVSPVISNENTVEHILVISRDITEEREHEIQQRSRHQQFQEAATRLNAQLSDKNQKLLTQSMMMREIDHRVKNSLAMVAAVLRMQVKSSDSPETKAVLEDATNRILTVSQVHAQLYRKPGADTVNLAEYLTPLCHNLIEAMAGPNITFLIETEAIEENAQTALALGLILAELVSNSIRHAFASEDIGTISVSLSAMPDGQKALILEDDGSGLPEGFDLAEQMSLGSKIISLYSDQIGAVITPAQSMRGGARFEIIF